jgi:hypothetical protein
MNLIILGLGILLLAGCSVSEVYIIPPAGTGSIIVNVTQERGVPFVGLDGVQANVPLQGPVTAPTNAPVIDKHTEK